VCPPPCRKVGGVAREPVFDSPLGNHMPIEDDVCTGMDVPLGLWTEYDIWFWTGTPSYQPWKDVATFFREVVLPENTGELCLPVTNTETSELSS